jgi:hypothetical protein
MEPGTRILVPSSGHSSSAADSSCEVLAVVDAAHGIVLVRWHDGRVTHFAAGSSIRPTGKRGTEPARTASPRG